MPAPPETGDHFIVCGDDPLAFIPVITALAVGAGRARRAAQRAGQPGARRRPVTRDYRIVTFENRVPARESGPQGPLTGLMRLLGQNFGSPIVWLRGVTLIAELPSGNSVPGGNEKA